MASNAGRCSLIVQDLTSSSCMCGQHFPPHSSETSLSDFVSPSKHASSTIRCVLRQVRKLLMTPNNPHVVSPSARLFLRLRPRRACLPETKKTCLFQLVLHCVLSSAPQPPYSHHFPDSLYGNILAVDMVRKTRNSLSSSNHFLHHSPRWSQNKYISFIKSDIALG